MVIVFVTNYNTTVGEAQMSLSCVFDASEKLACIMFSLFISSNMSIVHSFDMIM